MTTHQIADFIDITRPGGGPWHIARRVRPAALNGAARPGLAWFGGFASDMRGTKAEFLDAFAAARGLSLLRFDYSGHGESEGLFEEGTIGDWLEQSLGVFRASTTGPQIIIGSSMGAWIALLLARRLDALGEAARVHGLLLLAPAVDFTEELMWKTMPESARQEITETGVWRRPSPQGGPPPITRRLIEEGRAHLLLGGEIRTHAPVRILQGAQDEAVPWRHALRLVERLPRESVTFTLIPDGDHRLSRPQDLELMAKAVEELA